MQRQILIAEENALNREILCEILSGQYRVLQAENGQQAFRLLRQYSKDISLILLDVMMPVMDGYTFLDRLKADPELSLIPVIVTTPSDSEQDEITALSHGATDFVPKPYRPQVILHRVASIINLRENAAMVNQFKYDRLTGLYNKEYFYQQVWELLAQYPDRQYDIVCTNLENFKLFNDLFGASVGDRLLREVAELCREQTGEHEFCGRVNADRFICLWERGRKYSEDWFRMLNVRIRSLSSTNIDVVLRWGIYQITDRSVPVVQMCDRALLAADSIKGQYQKHVAFYADELRYRILREQSITAAMEAGLTEGQFVVYLQPQYSLDDNQISGAELLVRWNHPKLGLLSPSEFIPLFEKNGFIPQLDRFVWERACILMREWRDKGLPIPAISVNMSRADMFQADLPEFLINMVRKYGLSPDELHLEVTESIYTENPNQIVGTVDQLRALGFVIEMDDFGSGYSSLNMLTQMKLDILKLDRKFIQNETAKPANQSILRFMINLARWMKLPVVAEGVENREQAERLREVGCDYAQGYFFARPMPSGEFEQMLRAQMENQAAPSIKETAEPEERRMLLVVDENPAYRKRIVQTFENQYHVLEAADGWNALSLLDKNEGAIAAVILSLTLPERGGFAVLKALRDNRSAVRIPVMISEWPNEELERQAFELGADDFLYKEHTIFGLRRRVERLLDAATWQERERRLLEKARRDELTGLFNRRGLHDAVEPLRREDLPLAVYIFDLDRMKQVNDRYGHDAGDQMLKAFSDLLRSSTCETDVLARYGGDEFIVVMKRMGTEQDALKKGEAICRDFRRCELPENAPAVCSAGVAWCEDPTETLAALITRADQALYCAKKERTGSCCLWNEECPPF